MTKRNLWKLRIILLKFLREATPRQLLMVVDYAASLMVRQCSAMSGRGSSDVGNDDP